MRHEMIHCRPFFMDSIADLCWLTARTMKQCQIACEPMQIQEENSVSYGTEKWRNIRTATEHIESTLNIRGDNAFREMGGIECQSDEVGDEWRDYRCCRIHIISHPKREMLERALLTNKSEHVLSRVQGGHSDQWADCRESHGEEECDAIKLQ